MKKYPYLFDQVTCFKNIYLAGGEALAGKRSKAAPAAFLNNRLKATCELQALLQSGDYRPGPYKTSYIYEPKKRMISAASFIDRVVHHAICRVIEPIFEPSFIFDSYACRKGKGTHAAINRFTYYARRYRYCLKCDIKKFFPSIDHEILKIQIRNKIADERLLNLIDLIIGSSNPQEPVNDYFPADSLFTPFERRKGLPIGNLTSQFFANIFLNRFDHYIKDDLGVKAYARYVDDTVFFDNEVAPLLEILTRSQRFLADYRVLLHPKKCNIFQTEKGVPFLGFIVFPNHRLVKRASVTRYKRKLARLQIDYGRGIIGVPEVRASISAWVGHVKHADSWGLRKMLLGNAVFRTVN